MTGVIALVLGSPLTPRATAAQEARKLGNKAAPLAAAARQMAKIAFLCPRLCSDLPNTTINAFDRAFLRALQESGSLAGRDVSFDMMGSGVGLNRLDLAAKRLVERHVDVIVAVGNASARAARRATLTTPIVMINVTDPVEEGLIASLARPGGNVTGLTVPLGQLAAKHLELLKEIQPRLSRVAVLWDSTAGRDHRQLARIEAAGQRVGVRIHAVEAARAQDLEEALAAREGRVGGLLVLRHITGASAIADRDVVMFALKHRLPTIASDRVFVQAGGLMAYGANRTDLYERAATYVAAILGGRTPAQLPVEGPTRFELVVSETTGNALGLTIPASVLVQADEVIE